MPRPISDKANFHPPRTRLPQLTLIATFLAFSWLAMQMVHELGHVAAAKVTGGRVVRVVLHPLAISRTDVHPNPRPLMVAWAGPLVGVGLPLLALLLTKAASLPGVYLVRFFAGFCLVANGVYLGAGAFFALGDAGEIMAFGSPRWLLVAFGLATIPMGLALWNGLGPSFGLGAAQGRVSRKAAAVSAGLFAVAVALGVLVGA